MCHQNRAIGSRSPAARTTSENRASSADPSGTCPRVSRMQTALRRTSAIRPTASGAGSTSRSCRIAASRSAIRPDISAPWLNATTACDQEVEPRGAERISSSASAIVAPIICSPAPEASQRMPSRENRSSGGGAQPRPRPARAIVASRSRT